MSKIQNSKSGFTLIEMLVAISIFTILMLAVTTFFAVIYKEQANDIVKIEGANIDSRILEKMSNEIRKMNRGENGNFAIELADKQDFIFYSDIDNDGLTEKIEYLLNGTDFEKKVTEPGASMDYSGSVNTTFVTTYIRNGATPIFIYYDKNYTGNEAPLSYPANVTQIRIVGISVDVNVNENYPLGLVHAEVKINPRNLKSFN